MNALAGQHVKGHPRLRLTVDDLAPATRLLDKKREIMEVQETLEAQKKDFALREESLRAREEQLNKKNVRLRQSLFKFNKFLHDNDLKRERAERKAKDEAAKAVKKQEEVEELREELVKLTDEQVTVAANVERSRRYQEYLETVCEAGEDQKQSDVQDLLSRYETLTAAHEDLVASTKRVEREIEKVRQAMQAFVRERSTEILRSNNELARLQTEAESVAKRRLQAQQDHENNVAQGLVEQAEYARVRQAVENLFERVLGKSMIRHKETGSIKYQLRIVKQFVGDLVAMTEARRAAGAPQGQQQLQAQQHAGTAEDAGDAGARRQGGAREGGRASALKQARRDQPSSPSISSTH